EPWCAGTCRPDCAIIASRPTVFSATVFPPVFGPVMIKVWNRSPRWTSIGTTVRGGTAEGVGGGWGGGGGAPAAPAPPGGLWGGSGGGGPAAGRAPREGGPRRRGRAPPGAGQGPA